MATVFTMVINGELPGRFVWKDDICVAFLTISPLTPGHTLVVPRAEVDKWTDLDDATWTHVSRVARYVGRAIEEAFQAPRIGVVIAGYEVPHAHVHVFAAESMADFDFSDADPAPDPHDLDEAAHMIRAALTSAGHNLALD